MYFSKYFNELRQKPPVLSFQKLHPDAVLPTRGSEGAIGLDLYAAENAMIDGNTVTKVRTGVAVEIPKGYYGRIAPRSGLAAKHGIVVLAGVIDDDYRGEIIVLLSAHSSAWFHSVKKGDRIAQLILERADKFTPVWADDLSNTERQNRGFGSSGA